MMSFSYSIAVDLRHVFNPIYIGSERATSNMEM